mgnify:FL=1
MANEIHGKTLAATYGKLLITKSDSGFNGSGAGSERVIATDDKDGSITESCLAVGTARVGIGTSSPATLLELESATPVLTLDATTDNATLRLDANAATHNSIIEFYQGGSAKGSINFAHNSTAADEELRLFMGGASNRVMTILGSGKVGIGTNDPTGLLEIYSETNNRPNLYITNHSTTADDEGGNIVFRKGDGPIGGTQANLTDNDIVGDIFFEGLDVSDDTWTEAAIIRARINGTPGTDDMPGELAFYTNSGTTTATQKMCILSNGNVGIGTTDPVVKLQIGNSGLTIDAEQGYTNTVAITGDSGAIATTAILQFGDNEDTNSRQFAIANGARADGSGDPTQQQGSLFFCSGNPVNQDPMGDDSAGNTIMTLDGVNLRVGIGDTSPGNKFVVKGAVGDGTGENIIVVKESGGETSGVMGKSSTQDGYMNLYDASGNLDISLDSGNVSYLKGGFVGIGINPPLSPLHVYSSGETNIPIVHIEHGEGDMEAGDEILRLDASADQDIHGTQLKIITIHDGQDGEIGKFVTASDGNINTAWTNVSDVRLKKDIKDTSMGGPIQ